MKQIFEFTFVLGPDASPNDKALEDRLVQAGCDDALICAYGKTVFLQFEREATTARHALQSALRNICNAGFSIHAIEESGCASVSEMAQRSGLSRSAIDNYLKGRRGGEGFPNPVSGLSSKSPQFYWPEVAKWLYREGKIEKRIFDVAIAARKVDLAEICRL